MENRNNVVGSFLSLTVVSIIAAGFSQIPLPGTFNLLFPIYWALGLVGWLYFLTQRNPSLKAAASQIVSDIRSVYRTIRPVKPQIIVRQRCRYCKQMVDRGVKCAHCGAQL